MILVGIWGLGNLAQSFLVCRVHDGHVQLVIDRCNENTASLVATAVFNCLTNLVIGLLPIYTIWSLVTVSVSTRLGLTCVFVLGVRYVVHFIYSVAFLPNVCQIGDTSVSLSQNQRRCLTNHGEN